MSSLEVEVEVGAAFSAAFLADFSAVCVGSGAVASTVVASAV